MLLMSVDVHLYPSALAIDGQHGRAFMGGSGTGAGTGLVAVLDTRGGRVLATAPVPGTQLIALAVNDRSGTGYALSATPDPHGMRGWLTLLHPVP